MSNQSKEKFYLVYAQYEDYNDDDSCLFLSKSQKNVAKFVVNYIKTMYEDELNCGLEDNIMLEEVKEMYQTMVESFEKDSTAVFLQKVNKLSEHFDYAPMLHVKEMVLDDGIENNE
jgi:chorismate mutase